VTIFVGWKMKSPMCWAEDHNTVPGQVQFPSPLPSPRGRGMICSSVLE
jgi:hypothetical protein